MYKTETHLHTSEVSRCGKVSAAEMISRYRDAGYTTVFVCDHFTADYFRRYGDISWEEKVSRHLRGYRAAKEAGDALGVHVLLSSELRFEGSVNDYLLYGIDESFLLECRGVFSMQIEAFIDYAHARGVSVIQAHPMRGGKCTPTPLYVDGMEVYNTNPRHENFTGETLAIARQHGLLITSGSDAHRPEDIACGGIQTDTPITSAAEYIAALRTGSYRCIGIPENI